MGMFSEAFEDEIYELKRAYNEKLEWYKSYFDAIRVISDPDQYESAHDLYNALEDINNYIKEMNETLLRDDF